MLGIRGPLMRKTRNFHTPVRKRHRPRLQQCQCRTQKYSQKNENQSKQVCSCIWSIERKITCKVVNILNIFLPFFVRLVWSLNNFSLGAKEDSCLGHQRLRGDPLSRCPREPTHWPCQLAVITFLFTLIPVAKEINILKLPGWEIPMFFS